MQGYASSSRGGGGGASKIIKRTHTKTILVEFCYLGVQKGVHFFFGGRQSDTILFVGT
jgi:hypothetical protein